MFPTLGSIGWGDASGGAVVPVRRLTRRVRPTFFKPASALAHISLSDIYGIEIRASGTLSRRAVFSKGWKIRCSPDHPASNHWKNGVKKFQCLEVFRESFVNWGAVRIWAAILLLLDASFGLWNHKRFEKSLPKINIAKIALFEALAALLLLGLDFWLR